MIQGSKKEALVLIVDNDEAFGLKCRRLLFKFGLKTSVVTNTQTALAYLSSAMPDLILVDAQLMDENKADGVDCIYAMRSAEFDGIICVMISQLHSDSLLRAAAAGADTFFPKNKLHRIIPEVKAMLNTRNAEAFSIEKQLHSILDNVYLRACGLRPQQIELLLDFHSHGYPSVNDFASALEVEPITLTMRLRRIRKKLGLKNNCQTAALMTTRAAFSNYRLLRYNLTWSDCSFQ